MISRAYPPDIGGTGSMIKLLSEDLVNEGFKVTIITRQFAGAKKYEKQENIEIYRCFSTADINTLSPIDLITSTAAMSYRIIKKKECDVFHAHDVSIAGFAGSLSKKIVTKKPFILKYGGDLVFEYLSLKNPAGWDSKHGLEETLKWTKGVSGLLHKVQDFYFKTYDIIAPDSRYGENFLKRKGVQQKKIHYLPNGVDTSKFRPMNKHECRKKMGINSDEKIIFSASRLVGWKGHDVSIRALKELMKAQKKLKLVIAGTGPEKDRLVTLAESLGVKENVLFVGNILRTDMLAYYNAADVFVQASYFDTLPNSVLEAMACGVPIVASNIDGINELGKDVLILSKVGNPIDLAEKIGTLLKDEELASCLSKKVVERIKNCYSHKKVVKEYIALYDSAEDINKNYL